MESYLVAAVWMHLMNGKSWVTATISTGVIIEWVDVQQYA